MVAMGIYAEEEARDALGFPPVSVEDAKAKLNKYNMDKADWRTKCGGAGGQGTVCPSWMMFISRSEGTIGKPRWLNTVTGKTTWNSPLQYSAPDLTPGT